MVPLESRSKYLMELGQNPKLLAFYNMLYLKSIVIPPSQLSETDEIYYGTLEAIVTNNKNLFNTHFQKISKRTPSKDSVSPFVHDDLLIFTLLVGVIKFALEKAWLQNLLSIRTTSAITSTFDALIKNNYQSKSNLCEIVIPFLELLNDHSLSNDYLNEAYLTISHNQTLFDSRHDFQTMLSLKAYDSIVLSRQSEGSELSRLKEFEKKFTVRVRILTFIVYNGLLIGGLYFMVKLLGSYPEIKEYADTIGLLIGILGVSLANYFTTGKKHLEKLILRIGGLKMNPKKA
jgi:hypothetical protein